MVLSTVRSFPVCVITIVVAAKRNWLPPKLLFDSLKAHVPEKLAWAKRPDVVRQNNTTPKKFLSFEEYNFFIIKNNLDKG
jgi:hypothetical protein